MTQAQLPLEELWWPSRQSSVPKQTLTWFHSFTPINSRFHSVLIQKQADKIALQCLMRAYRQSASRPGRLFAKLFALEGITWEFISFNKSNNENAAHRMCVCVCVFTNMQWHEGKPAANLARLRNREREQKMLTFWQWREAAVPSASERSLWWGPLRRCVCVALCSRACQKQCV